MRRRLAGILPRRPHPASTAPAVQAPPAGLRLPWKSNITAAMGSAAPRAALPAAGVRSEVERIRKAMFE